MGLEMSQTEPEQGLTRFGLVEAWARLGLAELVQLCVCVQFAW